MKKTLLILLLFFIEFIAQAQVGINTANPNAQLDIRSSNQATPSNTDGLLLPKINTFPAINPTAAQQGMLVYLTTVSGANQPGFYYWNNPTLSWIGIVGPSGSNWGLTGNSGTNPTTNFIGTTDDIDITFKRNGIKSGAITASNTSFGLNTLLNNTTGIENTAVGKNALISNTVGNYNSSFGFNSAAQNSFGIANSSFGYAAMQNNLSGSENSAFGVYALHQNGANGISAFGAYALNVNSGTNNSAFGYKALTVNGAGVNNSAFGYETMLVSGGSNNSAFGSSSLKNNGAGNNNSAFGNNSLLFNTANDNSAFGDSSLLSNTSGTQNSAFGKNALQANSNGQYNSAFGYNSATQNSSGIANSVFGYEALMSNSLGSENTAFGIYALRLSNVSGISAFGAYSLAQNSGLQNSAFGFKTLTANNSGANNSAFGYESMLANNGSNNSAFGNSSLKSNSTGNNNSAFGDSALLNNTANDNTAVGANSLLSNTSGNENSAFGKNALFTNSSGIYNASFGTNSLQNNGAGSGNVALGHSALLTNTTGNYNTAIGVLANVGSSGLQNATAIGASALVSTDNSLVLGSVAGFNSAPTTVNVGIGTTSPADRLHVVGTIRMVDGNQGTGKVLVSDTNGRGTWTTFSAGGTLDQAYDFGGAGLGRTITADAGAVNISGGDGLVSIRTATGGAVAPTGAGVRMVWNPRKSAFRAGQAVATEWDDANIGTGSVAFGMNTTSSANQTTAFGLNSIASGNVATVFGSSNTASGTSSTSFGDANVASGNFSTAFGSSTIASGGFGTAFGYDTTASGSIATAFGYFSTASGTNATVFGRQNDSPSFGETTLGIGATAYTPSTNGATLFGAANATDRLLTVGNAIDLDGDFSVDPDERSDALVILKNGNTGFGTALPAANLELRKTNPVFRVAGADGNSSYMQLYEITGGNTFGYQFQYDGVLDKLHLWSKGFVGNDGIRMTWLKDGKVGIGTQTPEARLEIVDQNVTTASATRGNLHVMTDNPQNIDVGASITLGGYNDTAATAMRVFGSVEGRKTNATNVSSSGYLSFKTNFGGVLLERMRITHAGDVGIGTVNPLGLFELLLDEGRKPGTTTWTVVSDERLKTINGNYTKGLNEIVQLNPIRYKYRDSGERKFDQAVLNTEFSGFSAQEVQPLFPEAVGTDEDGFLNFNMHPILVASVNALKELDAKNKELKMENDALKQEIDQLNQKVNGILSTLETLKK